MATSRWMAYATFLRSPYPHARITVDVSEARALPGVVAVFTAADLRGVVNPIRGDASLPGAKPLPHTALASGKVRFVGDPIAMVIAENRYIAEDAVDLIQVDYEPLPPVPSIEPTGLVNSMRRNLLSPRPGISPGYARARSIALQTARSLHTLL